MDRLLGVAGDVATRDMEKAEILDAFFWPPFSTGRACPQGSQVPEPASRVCGHEAVPTVKEDRVKNHLSQLDIHESMGPGRMHPRVLKELGNAIAKLLPITFKRPWELGEVPRDWKKANITHFLEKGKKEDPSANYRPVSISSVPVEVVKPMLLEGLSQPTKDKKVIWSSQRGFAKGKSCLIDLIAL